MLDHHQLEQHYRVTAGPAIVLTVQIFYQIVDAREIHRRVDFPQQMVLGYQHVHTQHLDCLPLFGFSLQHLHHLFPLYQKRPLCATFFDRLSFLKYKKELPEYGYEVGKISMKAQTVQFLKKEEDA